MPMSIESRQAAAALSDIEEIVRRVRQSRTYHLASLMLIMWGVLVTSGHLFAFAWPRLGAYSWTAINLAGLAGSFAVSSYTYRKAGIRTFDFRTLVALLVFIAFGLFCCFLGHLVTPRQLATFWAIYFMMLYVLAGLWFGGAFVVLGGSVIALTLVGYFFVGAWFEPWMAVVNGGGLLLGGLWMRRN
jgi:hypothetical protein